MNQMKKPYRKASGAWDVPAIVAQIRKLYDVTGRDDSEVFQLFMDGRVSCDPAIAAMPSNDPRVLTAKKG